MHVFRCNGKPPFLVALLFAAVTNLFVASAAGQALAPGEELALEFRANVVAIEATWPDGTTRTGFGFITGQRGDAAYIATADHVVRSNDERSGRPDAAAPTVKLRLFRRADVELIAERFETHLPTFDLAVLKAKIPEDFDRPAKPVAAEAEALARGLDVWFVGRDGGWYVPSRAGRVIDLDLLTHGIRIEGLTVKVGTSGAPLISELGIVGMITSDDAQGDLTRAVTIEAVRIAFERWGFPWEFGQTRPQVGAMNSGDVFRDCADCPEMVVIPAGTFLMGSPQGEAGRDSDEGRQHRVTIAEPFAVGKYEVTFDEWDGCAAAGGCRGYRPPPEGWGRGKRPVINVSWDDAQAYVAWLSEVTGEAYRLPSEAEWEYVTRARTTTRYSWGDDITPENANYSESDIGKTTEVGSYPPNPWGLYDMHGNVREWVEDCWNNSYEGAPDDGSAWTRGDCGSRVLRGGSWFNLPGDLRSANRGGSYSGVRYDSFGFRIARTLR